MNGITMASCYLGAYMRKPSIDGENAQEINPSVLNIGTFSSSQVTVFLQLHSFVPLEFSLIF